MKWARTLSVTLSVLLVCLAGRAASAADELGFRFHEAEMKYEDVRDDLKNAIINRGFVIDHVGLFNGMLERTAEAVAATKADEASPYRNAEYLQFCPLKLTHEAVRASPFAIANCPISIFMFETQAEPGKVRVGYRLPPATASEELRKVNAKLAELLDDIAREAVGK